MSQKNIIISISLLFLASSAWLLFESKKLNDQDYKKDYWAVYFVDPKSKSLDFVIENHSDGNNFHFEVFKDMEKIRIDDVKIEKGSFEKVVIHEVTERINLDNARGKIIVRVSAGDEKKEIYKNFDK